MSKPKTARGQRFLAAAQLESKAALIVRSTTCTQMLALAMQDLLALSSGSTLARKNDVKPFVDFKPLEFLSTKNNANILVVGAHSKKNPNMLVFARFYDQQLLDMIHFKLVDIAFKCEFETSKTLPLGNRPLVTFHGDFAEKPESLLAMNMLLDFFTPVAAPAPVSHGQTSTDSGDQFDLNGISHVISCTLLQSTIKIRTYTVQLLKSGTEIPKAQAVECGPHFDFEIVKTLPANEQLLKEAMKRVKPQKKVKNSVRDQEGQGFGEKKGRVWMEGQDLAKLQTRKMKGLKRKAKDEDAEDDVQESN